MTGTLLVIDDDPGNRRLVKAIFDRQGFEVLDAHDGATGLEIAAASQPDVVLLDLRMPGLDGFEVLEQFTTSRPGMPVVILTGSQDVKDAVRATQLGAFNYLTKPVNPDDVVIVVRQALETRALRLEVQELRQHVGQDANGGLAAQMGSSDRITRVIEQVGIVAASNFTVLVSGETGTGKELVSRAIHKLSDRRRRPFVALDCGAIPEPLLESELFGHEKGAFTGAERRREGRVRLAEGGTCFLDEVGNLATNLQAKLLRVLESGEVQPVGADRARPMDVRFVSATNHDLQGRIGLGLFRPDLYFRLAQYTIRLPSLRERTDDIAYLTERFLEEASIELRRPMRAIGPGALDLLRQHSWPGNVRELRNVVRQMVLQAKGLLIQSEAVRWALSEAERAAPLALGAAGSSSGRSLREVAVHAAGAAEHQAICDTLRATAGNKSMAAKALKTNYKTLHLKMKHLGIRAHDFSP
jgi:two-component system nitrogen regulation response regulator GlnG